jgi:cell division septal protein FtsQ
MPDNELSPEEIKALKEISKYHRLNRKITPKLFIVWIILVLVCALIFTAVLMYWLSIPIENIPSF